MIDDDCSQTAMAREIREIPTTAERLLGRTKLNHNSRKSQQTGRSARRCGFQAAVVPGTLEPSFATYLKRGQVYSFPPQLHRL